MNPALYMRDGQYDVGRIVRDLNAYYIRGERVARIDVLGLLAKLASFTESLAEHMESPDWLGGISPTTDQALVPDSIVADFRAWQERLARYVEITKAAPAGRSMVIAEHVAGPLLLGWFPGEDAQKPADVGNLFRIASQVDTSRKWQKDNLIRFSDDLRKGAKDVAKIGGLTFGAVVAAGLVVMLAGKVID